MDEAILEDSAGELIRNRQNVVTQMQVQVRKALARIKLGKYGYCEVCGKPIDKARLEAYPEATTCLEHAPKE
jgi:RNA polymerase-binding transcription factor DksA